MSSYWAPRPRPTESAASAAALLPRRAGFRRPRRRPTQVQVVGRGKMVNLEQPHRGRAARDDDDDDDDAMERMLTVGMRDPSCLTEADRVTGQVLGAGSFGSVYAINDASGRPSPWVLKISNLTDNDKDNGDDDERSMSEDEKERRTTFKREVYYLEKLKDEFPQLVPRLKNWRICAGQGLQVLERFEESAKELGQRQAAAFGLDGEDNLAFTKAQLASIATICTRLDKLGILHADAKLANFLVKDDGHMFVMADFGFSGEATAAAPFSPLQGFTTQLGCPGEVVHEGGDRKAHLAHPVPHRLVPYWNRIQTIINIRSRALFLLDGARKRLVGRAGMWEGPTTTGCPAVDRAAAAGPSTAGHVGGAHNDRLPRRRPRSRRWAVDREACGRGRHNDRLPRRRPRSRRWAVDVDTLAKIFRVPPRAFQDLSNYCSQTRQLFD